MGSKSTRYNRNGPLDVEILRSGILLSDHESRHVNGAADAIDSVLDSRAIALTTHGDIVFRGAALLQRLGAGAAGQVLQTAGVGVDPIWAAAAAGRGDYTYLVEIGVTGTVYDNQGVLVHGPGVVAAEINWALANLTAGRTKQDRVVVRGEASINATLLLPNYCILDLREARLTLANASNVDMINNDDPTTGNTDITILNGYLNGNRTQQTAGVGIYLQKIQHCSVLGTHVTSCYEEGIYFYGEAGGQDYNTIADCFITDSRLSNVRTFQCRFLQVHNNISTSSLTGKGFEITNSGVYCIISENRAYNNLVEAGYEWQGAAESMFCNNHAYGNRYGLKLWNSVQSVIEGNCFYGNKRGGIFLNAGTNQYLVIDNNYVVDNSTDGDNTYDEIYLTGDHNIVSNNMLIEIIATRARYGIHMNGCDNCIVEGNMIYQMDTDGIHIADGDNNIVARNRIVSSIAYGINLDADSNYNQVEGNHTSGSGTACARVNNANCDNNVFTNNHFDEGDISDIGTNTRAWLNYDPSANAFIATINAPTVVGGGGGALP